MAAQRVAPAVRRVDARRRPHGGQRVLAAAAAAIVLVACGTSSETTPSPGPPPPVVEVATVRTEPRDTGLTLVGQLEADESVMLRPEIEGVVATVHFREGEEVPQGMVLFRLRDAEQRARLREAEADLVLAEQAWGRVRSLEAARIVSAAELDHARATRDAAAARLDLARVELERTVVRAPFAGMLGQRLVSPGDRVTKTTDLGRIDAVARLKLAIPVPEPLIERVAPGMAFTIAVAPFPGERFPGTVYFAAPSLDPTSRQLLLRGYVPNPDRRLRPGLFATVRVATEAREEALFVPESAVVYDAGGPFVWRIGADGRAERTSVVLGDRRDGLVEVREGLAAGDRVVSAGTNKVLAGAPVREAEGQAGADEGTGS